VSPAGRRGADRGFTIRDAAPAELAAVGVLTSEAYAASGDFTGPFSAEYDLDLRDAEGRSATAAVLVAVDETGTVLGTATLARHGSPNAHVARDGEQELRMLAVAEAARGRGVGSALVEECAFRAGLDGADALVISVYTENSPAQRMYAKQAFVAAPARDWTPEPGITLGVWRRVMDCGRCGRSRDDGDHVACDAALVLEPPRYCPACRRRMTVQVSPAGWRATCSVHGDTVRGTAR